MDNLLALMIAEQQKQELSAILDCNRKTEQFGLSLSDEEAKKLVQI